MSEQSELIADDSSPAAVVVSWVMACAPKRVWQQLISKSGAQALLGPGATFGEKGQTWASDDGHSGVVRTLHPLEEIRFSFRKDLETTPSMVQILLAPTDDSTELTLTHTNVDPADEAWFEQRWNDAMASIEAGLA